MEILIGLVVVGIIIYILYINNKPKLPEQSGWLPPVSRLNENSAPRQSDINYRIVYDGRAEGGEQYPFNIVGEAAYQNNIARFALQRGERGVFTELDAIIQHEPANNYDSNACKVTINNFLVGYLAKNHAKSWLNMLQKNNILSSAKIHVSAVIVGGGKGFENYGVRLDVPERIANVATYLQKI